MGKMAESLALYAQPLLEDTDGSQEQMQSAYSMAQVCWNLSLLPKDKQNDSLAEMQPMLEMNDTEFAEFCSSVIEPMVKRHHELFPNFSANTAENSPPVTSRKKYHGTGRNDPCPCNSGKKYKKCCGG